MDRVILYAFFLYSYTFFCQNKRVVINSSTFNTINNKELLNIYNASFVSLENFSLKDSIHVKKFSKLKSIEIPEYEIESETTERGKNIIWFLKLLSPNVKVEEIHFYEDFGLDYGIVKKFKNLKKITLCSKYFNTYSFDEFPKLRELNLVLTDSNITIQSQYIVTLSIVLVCEKSKIKIDAPKVKKISLITPHQKSVKNCEVLSLSSSRLMQLSLFCEVSNSLLFKNLTEIDELRININDEISENYIKRIKSYLNQLKIKKLIILGVNTTQLQLLKSELKLYNVEIVSK